MNGRTRTTRPRTTAAALPRTAKIWERFHVGMQVTVGERVEAYSSGYAGNPVCFLEPAMVGVIAAVDVPYVRRSRGRSETFACVDFIHDAVRVVACPGDTGWTGYTAADKAVLAFVTNEGVGIFDGAAALERTRAALAAAGYVLEVIAS